ncbi:hypothetical protein HF086_008803 [Spodoptera exigua]|uniref:Uncharacterized protein n=1 Tax=Spodoptera exigua TaxID=7107 RepID=A0A922SQX9_SPOEX|nr:hypothetical protein HF086_008803 [Spodoptera exigua]
MLQRQQYSPMGGAPASPSVARSPHVARTPTPHASPAASPRRTRCTTTAAACTPTAPRRCRPATATAAPACSAARPPGWPPRSPHVTKVSILKRRTPPRPRAAPSVDAEPAPSDARGYVVYAPDARDADDGEDLVEHLDDDDIVLVEPDAVSPEERIATEEDFEELIDSGKPDDDAEEETAERAPTRTETTTKTVAVISLSTGKQPASVQQYKILSPSGGPRARLPLLSASMLSPHSNTKILDDVSQATVASVSIANQTISVPVLKNLSVPIASVASHVAGVAKPQIKKVPLNLAMSTPPLSKPISSVISVISSNMPKTTNPPRVPVSILTQHQVKQKIVKTIEKPMMLALSNSKLSSLSVTHDATLPAKIFQDDAASPDSTVSSENNPDKDLNINPMSSTSQQLPTMSSQGTSQMDPRPGIFKEPTKDIDIESEISQQTELPHTLCLSDRTPLLLGKADIKSPDPIPEKIPDNIMEGDDEDKPEDNLQSNLLLSYSKSISEPPPQPTIPDTKMEENVVKTIKAIANQTKEMVIDSNMQITSDMAQDSVQISIPSPTPSQERYLNDITMQDHHETAESNKHVETFEDMLCILENIGDDAKTYGMKQSNPKPSNPNIQNQNVNTTKQDPREGQEQTAFAKREPERLALQSASVPQLSPLSQPAELTSNMANVSQQLRTIMSSLNTNTSKVDTQPVMRKNSDATTPTQVNFENLLPSSKVEVAASRPSPIQRIDKPIATISTADSLPMSAAQAIGSRVNTLSSMGQMRKSPTISPISSPVGLQNSLMKSPAPMISNPSFSPMDESGPTSVASQIIQMPALSKIHSSTAPPTIMHSNNTITTSMSSFQKNQSLPTSILGHTLLQPTRQINTSNLPFNQQSISTSQPPALVMTSRSMIGNKETTTNMRPHSIVSSGINQIQGKPAPPGSINFITSSKLLHTQLTSPLKRSKSTDEPKSEVIVGHIQPTKRHSVEAVVVKSEPMETDEPNTSTTTTSDTGSKHTNVQPSTVNQKNDESQNVLLKQLLQTTTTAATVVPARTMTIQRTAPALGSIPSLEAQLARPSIPPPTLSLTQEVEIAKNSPRHNIITSSVVNSPFTSRPYTIHTDFHYIVFDTNFDAIIDGCAQATYEDDEQRRNYTSP